MGPEQISTFSWQWHVYIQDLAAFLASSLTLERARASQIFFLLGGVSEGWQARPTIERPGWVAADVRLVAFPCSHCYRKFTSWSQLLVSRMFCFLQSSVGLRVIVWDIPWHGDTQSFNHKKSLKPVYPAIRGCDNLKWSFNNDINVKIENSGKERSSIFPCWKYK